jgi:hypothetical protein
MFMFKIFGQRMRLEFRFSRTRLLILDRGRRETHFRGRGPSPLG